MYVIAMYANEDVKMVTRYDPISNGEFTPADDGPFVDYADYVALQAECERLRKELRNRGVAQAAYSDGWIVANPNYPPGIHIDMMFDSGNIRSGYVRKNDWAMLCTDMGDNSGHITHWRPSKVEE